MKISNSLIRSCLWALAFTSTSALSAAAPETPVPAAERALELEVALARKPDLYLVVDLAQRRLEVKARGLVLDSIELTDAALTRYTPLGGAAPDAVELPAVRTVVEPDARAVRKVVTATELVPYPGDDEPETPPTAPAASDSHSPGADHQDPEPPDHYRAGLDGGWDLWIGEEGVAPSLGERLARVLADGWRRLRSEPVTGNIVLGLAMTPEDARRLHHLLDQDATLLVR
jgi:hypothetical protein